MCKVSLNYVHIHLLLNVPRSPLRKFFLNQVSGMPSLFSVFENAFLEALNREACTPMDTCFMTEICTSVQAERCSGIESVNKDVTCGDLLYILTNISLSILHPRKSYLLEKLEPPYLSSLPIKKNLRYTHFLGIKT